MQRAKKEDMESVKVDILEWCNICNRDENMVFDGEFYVVEPKKGAAPKQSYVPN